MVKASSVKFDKVNAPKIEFNLIWCEGFTACKMYFQHFWRYSPHSKWDKKETVWIRLSNG